MPEIVEFKHEGFRWLAARGLAEAIRRGECPALFHPEDCPGATLVKQGRNRAVYRFSHGGEDFYLKQMQPTGWLSMLAARRRVRMEWQMSREARKRGIPAAEPVACAYGPTSMLVTKAVPGAVRLDEYLYESCFEPAADDPPFPGARPPELVAIYRNRRPGSGEIIKTVAAELAALAVTLHRAGAYFNDLHPGNILMVREGEPMLYLADLGRLTFRGSRDALLMHIVLLNAFFEPISTQTERFHFWKALGKHHDVPIPRPEQIAEATWRHRRRIYSRRDKRWAKFNKYVARVEAGPWRGRAVTDWLDAAQAVALAAAHPMSGGDARVVKHSGASTVIETDWGGRMPIVLKRDNRRGPVRQLRRMLGRCRAQRAWRIGHGLLMRGIPTARPAAVLERYAHGIAVETLLATEKIEDATRLDMWFKQRTAASERRGIIEQLARLVGRLHDLGISQRDLKAPNILVRNKGAGHVQLYLIDLDGLRFRRRVRPGRRLQNLMRLNVSGDEIGLVSRSDRLRFLRTYLRRPGRGALPSVSPHRWGAQGRAVRDIRRWWHRIAEASARKWVRLEKRQRERLARQSMTGR